MSLWQLKHCETFGTRNLLAESSEIVSLTLAVNWWQRTQCSEV